MQNLYRIDQMDGGDEFGRVFGNALNCSECGLCEHYSCPMTLSPRRVNAYVKTRLAGKTGVPVKNMNPESREYMEDRLVPTERLTARLGLSKYVKHLGDGLTELKPERVRLLLKQHTGAPCIPVVSQGSPVSRGDLIAAIPDGKLGCNLHASIDGAVLSVNEDSIDISGKAWS
jgi:Na+-translocating ferredoxin:NAD+ oxidoreductase RnfC subunit